jgi:hypothetical protein
MQACKPGSVSFTRFYSRSGTYHLSGPDFTIGIYQSTRPDDPDRNRGDERAALESGPI